jgi:hypothetical protein
VFLVPIIKYNAMKTYGGSGLVAKLLLTFASTVILGCEFHGTHDHILLSDGSGSLQTTIGGMEM